MVLSIVLKPVLAIILTVILTVVLSIVLTVILACILSCILTPVLTVVLALVLARKLRITRIYKNLKSYLLEKTTNERQILQLIRIRSRLLSLRRSVCRVRLVLDIKSIPHPQSRNHELIILHTPPKSSPRNGM